MAPARVSLPSAISWVSPFKGNIWSIDGAAVAALRVVGGELSWMGRGSLTEWAAHNGRRHFLPLALPSVNIELAGVIRENALKLTHIPRMKRRFRARETIFPRVQYRVGDRTGSNGGRGPEAAALERLRNDIRQAAPVLDG
jgi:hypothetical protein